MLDAMGGLVVLLYGTGLVWAAVNITRHQVRLVRVPKPASLVYIRLASIWSLGSVSVVAGLVLIAQGIVLVDRIAQ